MEITMQIESIAIKGKITKEGELQKVLTFKASMPFNPKAEAFISGHLMEAISADLATTQMEMPE